MLLRNFFLLPILTLLLFVISCTNTKITSTIVEEDYDKKVDGINYILYFSDNMIKTVPSFTEETKEHLDRNKINFAVKNHSSSDDTKAFVLDSLLLASKEKGFDHLLIVIEKGTDFFKSFTPGGGPSNKKITHKLDGILMNVSTESVLWFSSIEVISRDFGNSKQSGRSLARTLLEQLKEDAILKNLFIAVN